MEHGLVLRLAVQIKTRNDARACFTVTTELFCYMAGPGAYGLRRQHQPVSFLRFRVLAWDLALLLNHTRVRKMALSEFAAGTA
jgi:hypothetical protein